MSSSDIPIRYVLFKVMVNGEYFSAQSGIFHGDPAAGRRGPNPGVIGLYLFATACLLTSQFVATTSGFIILICQLAGRNMQGSNSGFWISLSLRSFEMTEGGVKFEMTEGGVKFEMTEGGIELGDDMMRERVGDDIMRERVGDDMMREKSLRWPKEGRVPNERARKRVWNGKKGSSME